MKARLKSKLARGLVILLLLDISLTVGGVVSGYYTAKGRTSAPMADCTTPER